MATATHKWNFYRAGGVEQVLIGSGADLVNLDQLDQKLWLALACPVQGTELDAATLALVDTDQDGRIRVPEVVAAIRWARDVWKNPDDLLKGSDSVSLSGINEKTDAGASVLKGARAILKNLGKADAKAIALEDVADTAKIFAGTRLNGDGVLSADATDDVPTQQAITDIMTVCGSVKDRSGTPGITQEHVDKFFAEASALVAWQDKALGNKAVMPLGEQTAAAAAAVAALKVKVDDYFTRARVAAIDPRAAAAFNGSDADWVALATKDLSAASAELARLPLARVEAGRALPLGEQVNPAWAAAVAELVSSAITPLLGASKQQLTEAEWLSLQAKVAGYQAWQGERPASVVHPLGLPRLTELFKSGAKDRIMSLLAQDKAVEDENSKVQQVERMVRYQRDLAKLLRNFVNFADFYGQHGAAFQAGTLYLDGRACDLVMRVEDAGKHAALASLAKCYLAYCDCTRPSGEKLTIVAAFTSGDSDNLMVGRNGIFYDRAGRDWDATITKIIENPLSIRQAFWSPYKSFVRLVEEQVSKRAAAADAESKANVAKLAESTAQADKTKAVEKPAEPKKIDVGAVAALGVAVAGLTTFLTTLLGYLLGMGWWIPLGVLGMLLAISGPSMLIAWLKLRQRNLAPLLDASGWAINAQAMINVPFGGALTTSAQLPDGAKRSLKDPFAPKPSRLPIYLFLLALLCTGVSWYLGKLDAYLPAAAKSTAVLGDQAPAASTALPSAAK